MKTKKQEIEEWLFVIMMIPLIPIMILSDLQWKRRVRRARASESSGVRETKP